MKINKLPWRKHLLTEEKFSLSHRHRHHLRQHHPHQHSFAHLVQHRGPRVRVAGERAQLGRYDSGGPVFRLQLGLDKETTDLEKFR